LRLFYQLFKLGETEIERKKYQNILPSLMKRLVEEKTDVVVSFDIKIS
jgi:hypothetical protein